MKKRKKINKSKLISILFFSLLLTLGIYFFLSSDFFYLKETVINNNNKLSKEYINKLLDINKEKNIFFYNLKDLEDKVNNSPYIKSCNIKRKIPNRLILEVEEKKIIGTLYNGKSYCYIDDRGSLVDEIDDIDSKSILINVDYSINKKRINFINDDKEILLSLISNLEDNNIIKKIKNIDMRDKSEINMKCKSGLTINFNKDSDINKTISRLNEVLIDLQNKKQYYGNIDLTYNKYILYNPYGS